MIRIGEFDEQFAKDSQVFIEGQTEFSVFLLDDENKVTQLIGNSVDRKLNFNVKDDCMLRVLQPKLMHAAIQVFTPNEKVSDIPVELDVDIAPKSMDQQIKDFCKQLVQHEYGKDSKEMDTFEDMFDFGDEDDGQSPLSGFEVNEMDNDFVEPINTDTGEPPPDPEPTTENTEPVAPAQ